MAITKSSATIIARGTSKAAASQLTGCSATRSGTTATLTKTSHGYSNGDTVYVRGFSLEEFNGVFTISNVATNTFDYTIKQDPGSNPSGTPGTVDKVTVGTALDLTAALGAQIVTGYQNGTTGPTNACRILIGYAAANNEVDYVWRDLLLGNTTANSTVNIAASVPPTAMWVNIAVGANTGQAVDCFALATTLDSAA